MSNSLLRQHQVLERFALLPTVSPEIPLICRKNATASQVLGKNDQRSIGQIHISDDHAWPASFLSVRPYTAQTNPQRLRRSQRIRSLSTASRADLLIAPHES